MGKIILAVVLQTACWLGFAASQEGALKEKPFYGNSRPARNIVIGKKVLQTLPQGTRDVEIVVAPNAFKTVRYAADAMQTYLGKRLNTKIPIVNAPDPGKTSIILGINSWSKKAGIDDKLLCRDAFMIRTAGKNIYILGRDDAKADLKSNDKWGGVWGTLNEHGTLFGVYDFLERFGGIRFYFPNETGIYIPENKPMEIPEINLFDRPDFEARNVSVYSGRWEDEKTNELSCEATVSPQKNVYSKMLRLQTKYVPNCHGLRALKLDERFGKTHPEYFALRSDGRRYCDPSMMFTGQLCYSSKVTDVIAGDALAVIGNQPPASRGVSGKVWGPTEQLPGVVFGMMPQDAYQNCQCEVCKKELATLKSTSNFMWKKTSEVAARIKKEIGHGYVSQMAYYPYHLVPDVEIPDNVLVMVAVRGPWSIAQPELLKTENERIRAWNKKINSKTWLWNYAGKFGNLSMPGIPATTPRSIAKYYQTLKNDIYGAYMESETEKLIYHYLNYYIFSKIAWDNRADADALLKEHYHLMFGKAAPVMEKLFDGMEELWLNRIGGRTVQTTLGPIGAPPSENELWTAIYTKQYIAQMTAGFDNAEKLAENDKNALKRVKYIRREFLDPIIAAAERYRERNNSIDAFRVELPATVYLQPFQGKNPAPLETSVKVSRDSDFLHVVFDCEEPKMKDTIALQRKLDDGETWKDNNVELFLDPSGERKEFYQLMVNSKGALSDILCTAFGSSTQQDSGWTSNAKVKTSVSKTGWRAEISIPLKSFRTPLNPKGFVANFTRNRVLNGTQQYYTWSPFLRLRFHELENFGTLVPQKEENRNILKTSSFDAERNGRSIGAWVLPAELPEGVSVELDRSTFVFGSKSLKLSNTNRKDAFVFAVTQTVQNIKPDTKYRLSFFVRLKDVEPLKSSGGICMNIWNGKNYWLPENKFIGTVPWFKCSFEFTSAPAAKQGDTYAKTVMFQCTGTVWFDGVTLEEIP